VISMRRQNSRELSDERILGSGDFVDQILRESDEKIKAQFLAREREEKVEGVLTRWCYEAMIQVEELRSGSRRPTVSAPSTRAARELVKHYGVSLAEAARVLGVTTSAISKMLQKRKDRN
jgi:putative transposase